MTRIATWNLAGRRGEEHTSLLLALDAEVLLLAEVHEALDLPGYHLHSTTAPTVPAAPARPGRAETRRWWAAVATREPARPCPDPHPASAMVEYGGRY